MKDLGTEKDWIIVTADIRIGKNPHEIAAWRQAGHTIFFLKPGWSKILFWEQAQKFVKCFPEILQLSARAAQGSSFLVSVNGKIEKG